MIAGVRRDCHECGTPLVDASCEHSNGSGGCFGDHWWNLLHEWKERRSKEGAVDFFFLPWPTELATDRTCYRALQCGHAWLIGCWLSVKSYLNLSHPFISFRFAMTFNIAFYRTPGTVTRAVCTQVSGHRSEDPRSSEWRCCTVPCLVCGV